MRDLATLGVFIDEQSSLLAQKIVQDYLRLRAGPSAAALFAEPMFRSAVEKARWEAYPLALAMVGETVQALLHPHAAGKVETVVSGLDRLVLSLFDRKGVPDMIGAAAWATARQDVSRSLNNLVHRPPKPSESIADSFAGLFLALMPMHEKLHGDDFPALRNNLKKTLAGVQEKLRQRANLRTLAELLAVNSG